jgi:uncharacterized membrane protein
VKKSHFAHWRDSFLTGLVIVLPGVITVAAVKWLFGTIASITDLLLFFLPKHLTHSGLVYPNDGNGPIYWYWSLLALLLAVALVCAVGVAARYYFGKRMIAWTDNAMLRVPVLNKIYGTIRQLDEAFTSGKKSSFKTVVLVEYPREGIYSVGFVTSEQDEEVEKLTRKKCVCVFIPTTPIPTAGFLIFVPKENVTPLDLSVADGFKYIISLGALSQERTTRITAHPGRNLKAGG